MGYVWSGLFGVLAVVIFNPLTWMIVATILIILDKQKKKGGAVQSGNASVTPSPNRPAIKQKPENPMAKWNWLLYIGSFLIVLAAVYFVDSVNDSFVAPLTILLTTVIYITGAIIHNKYSYLRPVGKAFIFSALFMIPLWLISFDSLGLPNTIAPFCVAICFSAASIIGALLTSSSVMAYFSYLSVVPIIQSIYPMLNLKADLGVFLYFAFLPLLIAALPPLILTVSGSEKMPAAFKHATKTLGIYLMPISYCVSLVLLLIPNLNIYAPLLRFICSIFFLMYALAHWIFNQRRKFTIILRFAAQSVILSLFFDVLDFSVINLDNHNSQISILICTIVWILTFMAQIFCSLFSRANAKKDVDSEHAVSIVSFVCILFAPYFCQGFEASALAAVWLTICLVIAILGVAHAIRYKNVTWCVATTLSMLIVPAIIGNYIASPIWDGGIYLAAYSAIAVLFLLGVFFLRRIQKNEANQLGIVSIIIACMAIIFSALSVEIGYVGYLIVSCILVLFAFIADIAYFYEAAIYTFAIALFLLTDIIISHALSTNNGLSNAGILKGAIDAHILGGAMIGAHFLANYLYKQKNKTRLIIGYISFSIIMSIVCFDDYLTNTGLLWPLLFLIEQVGALLYSVFKKATWMIWFSSVEIFLIAFEITGGMSYLWLGIIGVALIAIVIWQLKKANDKQEKTLTKTQ